MKILRRVAIALSSVLLIFGPLSGCAFSSTTAANAETASVTGSAFYRERMLLPPDARFEPLAPRDLAPIVFYGTSITHGASAKQRVVRNVFVIRSVSGTPAGQPARYVSLGVDSGLAALSGTTVASPRIRLVEDEPDLRPRDLHKCNLACQGCGRIREYVDGTA